jgi:hypothetical protein
MALRGAAPSNAEIQICNLKEYVCDFGRIAPGLERVMQLEIGAMSIAGKGNGEVSQTKGGVGDEGRQIDSSTRCARAQLGPKD